MADLVPHAGSTSLVPQSMEEAFRLAEFMAKGKMIPEHLRNPGDALMVIEQAMRWRMSPFAVAQATFSIKGKLLFAGMLVAAAIENSGAIVGLIDYKFSGEGLTRKVIVSATRKGETTPRTIELALKDAQTSNEQWRKQPDQQLVYGGARVWARRWTPGVILGVYTPEEFASGVVIDGQAEPVTEPPAPSEPQTNGTSEVVQWFKDLDAVLWQADGEGVDAIEARPDVQKMLDDHGRPKARDRLKFMLDVHRKRTTPVEADDEVTAPNEPSVEQQVANELNGYDNDPLMEPRDELTECVAALVDELSHANSATITKFAANPRYVKFLAEIKSRPELLVQVRDAAIAASQR